MAKKLEDVLTAGVRDVLGALQFQVIALQAENAVLREQLAALQPPPVPPDGAA
jgi:hypothetical protein